MTRKLSKNELKELSKLTAQQAKFRGYKESEWEMARKRKRKKFSKRPRALMKLLRKKGISKRKRKSKGKVPLPILKKRLARLQAIVKARS
jgi:hypothetical protein